MHSRTNMAWKAYRRLTWSTESFQPKDRCWEKSEPKETEGVNPQVWIALPWTKHKLTQWPITQGWVSPPASHPPQHPYRMVQDRNVCSVPAAHGWRAKPEAHHQSSALPSYLGTANTWTHTRENPEWLLLGERWHTLPEAYWVHYHRYKQMLSSGNISPSHSEPGPLFLCKGPPALVQGDGYQWELWIKQTWLCFLLSVWSCLSYLTALSLHFFFFNRENHSFI